MHVLFYFCATAFYIAHNSVACRSVTCFLKIYTQYSTLQFKQNKVHKNDGRKLNTTSSPPENILVLELLKATQKMLLWCSPFITAGIPSSLSAFSTSHSKILLSSPPAPSHQSHLPSVTSITIYISHAAIYHVSTKGAIKFW